MKPADLFLHTDFPDRLAADTGERIVRETPHGKRTFCVVVPLTDDVGRALPKQERRLWRFEHCDVYPARNWYWDAGRVVHAPDRARANAPGRSTCQRRADAVAAFWRAYAAFDASPNHATLGAVLMLARALSGNDRAVKKAGLKTRDTARLDLLDAAERLAAGKPVFRAFEQAARALIEAGHQTRESKRKRIRQVFA